MKNFHHHSLFSENRKIFQRVDKPKGLNVSSETAEPEGDTITESAKKFIDSSDDKIQVKGRSITLPMNKVNLDGEGGGGTKRVDMFIHGENLVVDVHNNDGSIDRITISSVGEIVKMEQGINALGDQKERNEEQEAYKGRANAPHTIADALLASEKFLGADRKWAFPPNGILFEKALTGLKKQLPKLASVLESKAQQGGVDEVNRFLREKRFTIQLRDMKGAYDVYTASVLDMNVRWQEPGKAVKLDLAESDKKIDAVSMPELQAVFESADHKQPIIQIETSTDETVFMTRYDGKVPNDSTSLYRLIYKLSRSKKAATGYKGAKFPMVDYNNSGNIEELIGARTTAADGDPAEIRQALYQHRLRVNEVGARAQAAAALGVSKGISLDKPVVIDGPFLIWFEKDGVIPFSAHITEEHMKKPKDLE